MRIAQVHSSLEIRSICNVLNYNNFCLQSQSLSGINKCVFFFFFFFPNPVLQCEGEDEANNMNRK